MELIFLRAERSPLANKSELFMVNFRHWLYTNPTLNRLSVESRLVKLLHLPFHFCVFAEVLLFQAQ